jgi:hypothetical protein
LHPAQRLGAYAPDGFEGLNVFLGIGGHIAIVIQVGAERRSAPTKLFQSFFDYLS